MQRASSSCRQLNSKTIRSGALCYLSPVFLGKCSIIIAKCVCKVEEEGFENAWNNVCRTRDACDRALQGWFVVNPNIFLYSFSDRNARNGCTEFFLSFLVGMRNVAFFSSAISAQSLKKQTKKKKADEDDEESDDNEQLPDSSPVAISTSQGWVTNHPTIVNQKLCPSMTYWIALTTPNGGPCSPILIHRALLECSVDVVANQVRKTLFTSAKLS